MAEDLRILSSRERVRFHRSHDRSRDVFVKVGAADPALHDTNNDLARPGRTGLGNILDPEVAGRMEAQGPQGIILSARNRSNRSVNDATSP